MVRYGTHTYQWVKLNSSLKKVYYQSYLTIPYLLMSKEPLPGKATEKTKKDQIEYYLGQNLSAPDIANLVGTSLGNVYKETALLRQRAGKAVLTKSKNMSVVTKTELGSSKISESEKLRLEVEHTGLVAVPGLEQADIKIIYQEFTKGKKPGQILAEYGFNPEAVEIEYHRFLRMNHQDRDELITRIFAQVVTEDSEVAARFLARYEKKKGLENEDLLKLLKEQNILQHDKGVDAILESVVDTSRILPIGWARLTCSICGRPIQRAIVQNGSHVHREIAQFNVQCETCRRGQ